MIIQISNTNKFINKANKIHNYKYDYSEVAYLNSKTKIKIICKEHGIFKQRPDSHLNGNGCKKCANIKKNNKNKFINQANEIHNSKYNYCNVNYINNKTKIKIICKKHGIFEQIPSSHLYGFGCSKCSISVSKAETAWLNMLNIPNDIHHRQVKIYINEKYDKKYFLVDGFDSKTNTIYEFYGDYWHGNPKIYNKDNKHPENGEKYGDLYKETINRENILKNNGYKLITMWESDFKKNWVTI